MQIIGKNKVSALANGAYREKHKSVNEDFEISFHQIKTKNLKPKRTEKFDIVEYICKEDIV